MSQSKHSFYVSEPVQKFYRWLHENSKASGASGDPSFLPYDILSAHLESNDYEVLNALLGAFYQEQAVPISAKGVVSAYSRIFCILLYIGKIDSLSAFMACDDLDDRHLPFKLCNRPNQFPLDPTRPTFYEEFCQEQFRFVPVHINANCNRRIEKEYVLPFTQRKQVAEGGSATISTIEIYPFYNQLPDLEHSTHESATIYALKTYRGKDAEKSWTNEVQTFQKLRDSGSSPYVIGFYTAFQHGSTWHCVLEYADRGSLEEYLQSHTPPEDGIDVARLWKRILGLIRGLKDLHNGDEVIFHQDIKPTNVLVLSDSENSSPYASVFKLADLGTSHSKRIMSTDEDHSDPDSQGTRTYGAPECYRPDSTLGQGKLRVTKAVDVFSLGCILSEVAVWMSGGYDYVMRYRQARQEAISQIPDFHDSDCFHNGISMLPIVGEWHRKLQSRLKSSDTVTPILIPLIEEMLLDAQHRVDASALCTKAHTAYTEAVQDFCTQSRDGDIPNDILPRALRGRKRRMDPPVRPFDSDQPLGGTSSTSPYIATGFMTSGPKNSPNELQLESLVQLRPQSASASGSQALPRGGHAFEFGTPLGKQAYDNSTPLEASTPISENHDTELRRFSDQALQQNRPSFSRGGLQISSMAEPVSGSALYATPPISPFPSAGLGVFANGNALGSNIMNGSHESKPYLPSTVALTLPHRPSTSCPVILPDIPPSSYSLATSRNPDGIVNYMSRAEALLWQKKKKSTPIWRQAPVLDDPWVLTFLEDRDSVMIIDDSESMRNHHWEDMTELLGILAYMIKPFDRDGLDLYFVHSKARYHENTASKLVRIVKEKKDEAMGTTDMSVPLELILDQYARKIRRQSQQNIATRGLNVYIFTDAIWKPYCDIVPAIDKMVETLVEQKLPEKQVGLQFISFGDDVEGLKRLRLVDNYLVSKPNLPYDIVDTTPSTGNLYKMIRGAIDRNYDYASEEASNSVRNSSHLPP